MTTVFSAFEQTARAHRARPFLRVLPEKLELSYAAALDRVTHIAARYRARGYGAGHRIALRLENRPDFLLHFLQLWPQPHVCRAAFAADGGVPQILGAMASMPFLRTYAIRLSTFPVVRRNDPAPKIPNLAQFSK